LRFYDVTSGVVKVDGIDIRSVTQASLRRQLASFYKTIFYLVLQLLKTLPLVVHKLRKLK
jgi:ABC-type bacteriocin/lantibiotic exporter with double-glycine peptidase domain